MPYKAIKLVITIHLILFTGMWNIAWSQQEEKVDDIKGKVLTLEECIRIAVERHPDIRSKIAEANAAKLRVKQSFSSFLPSLDFSSGYSKSRVERSGNQHSSSFAGSDSRDNYTVGFALSQNIFDFGRSLSNWRMSKEEANAVSFILNTTGQNILFNVEEAYYNHLRALRLRNVNEEAVASAGLHLKQAQGFYEIGIRPKIDVARANVDLSNAKVGLIKAKNAVRLAKVDLDNAMGLNEPVSYQIQDDMGLTKSDYHIDDLLIIAYRNRPELLELDARSRALEQKIKFNKSEHLPKLSGRLSYDWEGESSPLDREWRAGITLDVPLFSGLDTSYRLKEAHENLKGLNSRIDSLKLQIKKEVEQAILSLREAEERLLATRVAVEQGRENLRLAEGRYKVGLATIIDLTDARVLLLEVNTNWIQALYDYKIADALTKKSAGTIPFRIED